MEEKRRYLLSKFHPQNKKPPHLLSVWARVFVKSLHLLDIHKSNEISDALGCVRSLVSRVRFSGKVFSYPGGTDGSGASEKKYNNISSKDGEKMRERVSERCKAKLWREIY